MKLVIRSTLILFMLNIIILAILMILSNNLISDSTIAYTLRDARDNSNDVVMMDVRTGVMLSMVQGIGEGDVTGRTPIWSADGNAIAFWTFHNREDIFVHEVTLKPYERLNLTDNQDYLSLPVYGANNQRLLASFPTFNNVPIYLINDDYPDGDVIINTSQFVPTWSPDGRYLAYTATLISSVSEDEIDSGIDENEIDIFIIDVQTRNTINLTESIATSGQPIWLPDSSAILFVSRQSNFGQLYQIELASQTVSELPITLATTDIPTLSPDGRYLAYTSNQRINNQADIEVMLLDLETYTNTNISNSPLYDNQPTWSPDSQYLAYISRRFGNQDEIYIMTIATGHTRRLTYSASDEGDINWRPR